jgi:hypothetical protein
MNNSGNIAKGKQKGIWHIYYMYIVGIRRALIRVDCRDEWYSYLFIHFKA